MDFPCARHKYALSASQATSSPPHLDTLLCTLCLVLDCICVAFLVILDTLTSLQRRSGSVELDWVAGCLLKAVMIILKHKLRAKPVKIAHLAHKLLCLVHHATHSLLDL